MSETPTTQGFADRLSNATGLLGYVTFLLSPHDFQHYNGTYPDGMRDQLSGILEMASFFGFDFDFEANVSEVLNGMDAEDFFRILYDPAQDNSETADVDEGIQITLQSFERLMANEAAKEAFLEVAKTIIGTDPQIGTVLSAQENPVNLSGIIINGQPITELTLSAVNAGNISSAVSNMGNEAVLELLKSLPETAEDGEISQASVKAQIEARMQELDYDFTAQDSWSLEETINRAVTSVDTVGLTGLITGAEGAANSVYDGIRSALSEQLSTVLTAQKTAFADGSYINSLTNEDLFNVLHSRLRTEEGRASILAALRNEENLALIKRNLATMDIQTLMQVLPNGQAMVNEEFSNGIRQFLNDNGIFQMVSSIFSSFREWIGNFLEGVGLGRIAETLNDAMDMTKLLKPESPLQQQYQRAVTPVEGSVEPDPSAVQPDTSGVQPANPPPQ